MCHTIKAALGYDTIMIGIGLIILGIYTVYVLHCLAKVL